ncbi:MAG: GMC family oxidoreductase [Aquabacterium sp.]
MAQPVDAIVIGAGAGGAAAAWALTRKGLKVLVLEAGPWFDPDRDYGLSRPDWEARGFPRKDGSQGRYTFGQMQTLESQWDDLRSWHHEMGRMVHTPHRAVRGGGYAHVRGVGGSTLHYVGEAHRLHPLSMSLRSQHGVGADWPFDYATLEPYYVQAERVIGVCGPGVDADARPPADGRWRSAPYPLPPHAMSRSSETVLDAGRRLHQAWQPNPRATLSQAYDGRPPCNHCGGCTRGCPRRDKGSVDQTFIRQALASGRCEVRARCTVLQLRHGARRVIQGVRYVDAQGRRHDVDAGLVVLAAGAIESPRLLLTQRTRLAPHGIGNDHGQVGRHFMETVHWTSMALHPDPQHSFAGLPAEAVCWDWNRPDAIPDVIGGARFYTATLDMDLQGPISYASRLIEGWGRGHKQRLRAAMGHALAVGSIGESLPHPASYVDLDPLVKDAHGMPLARIHSHLDAMACKRLRFMAQTCRAVLKEAGCGALLQEVGSYDAFASTHVFGTCRSGVSPQDSVTNDRHQVHRWANLLICDGSTFPSTGGGESPSLTIQALALKAIEEAVRTG